jgi:hypothetical protein
MKGTIPPLFEPIEFQSNRDFEAFHRTPVRDDRPSSIAVMKLPDDIPCGFEHGMIRSIEGPNTDAESTDLPENYIERVLSGEVQPGPLDYCDGALLVSTSGGVHKKRYLNFRYRCCTEINVQPIVPFMDAAEKDDLSQREG